MHPLAGTYNAWAVYWPPGQLDAHGNPETVTPLIRKVNWMENASRSIVVDGEQYAVNDMIMTAQEVKEGGYLKRVTEFDVRTPLATAERRLLDSGDLSANYTAQPLEGQIRSVSQQNTFANLANKVYTAMI